MGSCAPQSTRGCQLRALLPEAGSRSLPRSMWALLRTFLLLGLGYLLGVAPSFNHELFMFVDSNGILPSPAFWLSVGIGSLLLSFYIISIPLSRFAKAEKAATERYLSNNKSGMSDYLPRRGSF